MYTNWKGGKLKRLRSRSTSCGGNLNEERREGGGGIFYGKNTTHIFFPHTWKEVFFLGRFKNVRIYDVTLSQFLSDFFVVLETDWRFRQKTCLCPYNKRLCIQYFNTFLAWNNFRGPEKASTTHCFPAPLKKALDPRRRSPPPDLPTPFWFWPHKSTSNLVSFPSPQKNCRSVRFKTDADAAGRRGKKLD